MLMIIVTVTVTVTVTAAMEQCTYLLMNFGNASKASMPRVSSASWDR